MESILSTNPALSGGFNNTGAITTVNYTPGSGASDGSTPSFWNDPSNWYYMLGALGLILVIFFHKKISI